MRVSKKRKWRFQENNFVRRTAIAAGFLSGVHIGLKRADPDHNDVWVWTDGSRQNYTNFFGGQKLELETDDWWKMMK